MSGRACLVGLDLGTSRVKAVALSPEGAVLAGAATATPVVQTAAGGCEHPVAELQAAVLGTLAELASHDLQPLAIATASMGETGVIVGADGSPQTPMIAWRDLRAAGHATALCERIGARDLYAITGHASDAHFAIARLMWLREHCPDAFAPGATWLSVADLATFWLTGERATDASVASRTLALDQRSRCWSPEVLAAAGIDEGAMPPIVPAGVAVGGLTPAAAERIGFPAGTSVAIAGHDRLCGAFAARGATDAAVDSVGTAEALVVTTPRFEPYPRGGAPVAQYADVVPGRFAFSARVAMSGLLLEWWTREMGGGDLGAALAALPQPLAFRGIVALPSFGRPISPFGDGGATPGAFVGATVAHGAGDFLQALLEGTAFSLRLNIETLEHVTGGRLDHVRVESGRAGRQPATLQLRADVLGRPVEVVELDDATAVGAALLAGVAGGAYPDAAAAASAIAPATSWYHPDPARSARYAEVYGGVYGELAALMGQVGGWLGGR
jgi:xylulokinase